MENRDKDAPDTACVDWFILLYVVLSCLAWADGLPNVPYLYVEGNAEVEKKADLVSLSFKLSATDAEVSKANSAVQTQALKVFALLSDSSGNGT